MRIFQTLICSEIKLLPPRIKLLIISIILIPGLHSWKAPRRILGEGERGGGGGGGALSGRGRAGAMNFITQKEAWNFPARDRVAPLSVICRLENASVLSLLLAGYIRYLFSWLMGCWEQVFVFCFGCKT